MKKKSIVVMPAYNAAKTLEMTYNDINREVVDEIILVDDGSRDNTVEIARKLGLTVFAHPVNIGYGANLKTCFTLALGLGADIVIVIHPDYQYCPKHLDKMVEIIEKDEADAVLGSRILGGAALEGGMPKYKYLGNLLLNFIQNSAYGLKLSDYASGYKAIKREVLEKLPYQLNRNDFVFDEEINTQIIHFGFRLTQIPVPTRYFKEASSVNFFTSLHYGIWTILLLLKWLLHKSGLKKIGIFSEKPKSDTNKRRKQS